MNVPKDLLKYRTGYSKISRLDGEVVEDLMKRYLSRRQPIKFCREMCGYCHLNASVTIQFLREDYGGVSSVRFKEGSDKIAVGFNFGYLQVVQRSCRDPPVTVLTGWEGHDMVSCVRWFPGDEHVLYASSSRGVIDRCDLSDQNTKHETVVTEENNEINSFDFDRSGKKFVTGGKDACLRVYDASTNRIVNEYGGLKSNPSSGMSLGSSQSSISHEKRIYCIKFHPNTPDVFLSGGWDGVRVWDVRLVAAVRNIPSPYIFGESVDISGQRVVTGSCVAVNSLQLWDLGSGQLLRDIQPTNRRVSLYGEYPYAVQYYRGDTTADLVVVGGAGQGGLQLISLKDTSVIYLFGDDRPVVAVDSADRIIAFGGKSNNLVLSQPSSSEDLVDPPIVVSDTTSYQTMKTISSEINII